MKLHLRVEFRMKIYWFFITFAFYGCTISLDGPEQPVKYVDLEKFMGKWYVIAFTPTFVDEVLKRNRNLSFR